MAKMPDAYENTRIKDFEWFVEHYEEIYQKYGECYVAIRDQVIVGVFSTFIEAIHETEKTFPPGMFNVQHCNGDESGYTEYLFSPGLIQ